MRDDLSADEIAKIRKMLRERDSANPLERGGVDSGTLTIRSSTQGLLVTGTGQFRTLTGAKVLIHGLLEAGAVTVEDQAHIQGNAFIDGQLLTEGDVFFEGIPETTTTAGKRMLVITDTGLVQSAAVPAGGGGDPPGGTTFMAPFPWSTVTSEYGPRDLPGTSPFHRGIDFGIYPAVEGATIVAAGSGVVSSVSLHSDAGPYGLEINHGPALDGKNIRTQYWHNNSRLVNLGDTVAKGQAIATVGNLGNSYGAHLHWECHVDGAHMNPRDFIAQYADG